MLLGWLTHLQEGPAVARAFDVQAGAAVELGAHGEAVTPRADLAAAGDEPHGDALHARGAAEPDHRGRDVRAERKVRRHGNVARRVATEALGRCRDERDIAAAAVRAADPERRAPRRPEAQRARAQPHRAPEDARPRL